MKKVKPNTPEICVGDLIEFQGMSSMSYGMKPRPCWKPGVVDYIDGNQLGVLVSSGRVIKRTLNRCRRVS